MINNTHYNLIDTLLFCMGKEKMAKLYNTYSVDMTPERYSADNDVTLPIAYTLCECFHWAAHNEYTPWIGE